MPDRSRAPRQGALTSLLIEALQTHVVVAAMGPTCHATLQVHGAPVHVMPEVPKMGPLIRSLMLHLQQSSRERAGVQAHQDPEQVVH